MPTTQDIGAVGYERQGYIMRVIGEILAGIGTQGSAYLTTTLWESVRSVYVGWKWAMDALTDGFRASAWDPVVSAKIQAVLGGVATNATNYYGGSDAGGRGFLTAAALDALQTSQAYNSAPEQWATGASYLFQRAAEAYALFWRNAP